MQVKHDDDDEWITFTADQARQEMRRKNDRRAATSNIHKSPTDGLPPTASGTQPTTSSQDGSGTSGQSTGRSSKYGGAKRKKRTKAWTLTSPGGRGYHHRGRVANDVGAQMETDGQQEEEVLK